MSVNSARPLPPAVSAAFWRHCRYGPLLLPILRSSAANVWRPRRRRTSNETQDHSVPPQGVHSWMVASCPDQICLGAYGHFRGRRARGKGSSRKTNVLGFSKIAAELGCRYCLAIAILSLFSGEMRWSWPSFPMSICTQAMSPVNLLPVGPYSGDAGEPLSAPTSQASSAE
jgi:hypothetical protein